MKSSGKCCSGRLFASTPPLARSASSSPGGKGESSTPCRSSKTVKRLPGPETCRSKTFRPSLFMRTVGSNRRRRHNRESLLHQHADLLHQRGAAPRARVYDDGRRCGRTRASPDGRRGVLFDGDGRARPESRASGPESRSHDEASSPIRRRRNFVDLLPTLNIANDDFIRTTEARHKAASQALWRRVRDRGYIYKGKYEGWYCTVDEVFVPETQLVDGRCPICGSVVERIAEESYFFKLVGVSAAASRSFPQASGFRHAGRVVATR